MQHPKVQFPENPLLIPAYLTLCYVRGMLNCYTVWSNYMFPEPLVLHTDTEHYEVFLRRKRAEGFGGETAMA